MFQWRYLFFQWQIYCMHLSCRVCWYEMLNISNWNFKYRQVSSNKSKLYIFLLWTKINQLLSDQSENLPPLKYEFKTYESCIFGSLKKFREIKAWTIYLSNFSNLILRKIRSLPNFLYSFHPDPQKIKWWISTNYLWSGH